MTQITGTSIKNTLKSAPSTVIDFLARWTANIARLSILALVAFLAIGLIMQQASFIPQLWTIAQGQYTLFGIAALFWVVR